VLKGEKFGEKAFIFNFELRVLALQLVGLGEGV
jgi:hypothetical protein